MDDELQKLSLKQDEQLDVALRSVRSATNGSTNRSPKDEQRQAQSASATARSGRSVNPTLAFGADYIKRLCNLVHYYLEVNIDDKVCYVGATDGDVSSEVEADFCLIKPLERMLFDRSLGTNSTFLDPESSLDEAARTYQKVEANLKNLANGAAKDGCLYDRVIMKDVFEHVNLQQASTLIQSAMYTISDFGKLVIIMRPYKLATLPYYDSLRRRLRQIDVEYLRIIDTIQRLGYDVNWNLELVPVFMTGTAWLKLLYDGYPHVSFSGANGNATGRTDDQRDGLLSRRSVPKSVLDIYNNPQVAASESYRRVYGQTPTLQLADILAGTRELADQQLRYFPPNKKLEFFDRVLIIQASHPLTTHSLPVVKQAGKPPTLPTEIVYRMEVTADIEPYLKKHRVIDERKNEKEKPKAREWWGTTPSKPEWLNIDSHCIPSKRINRYLK